MTQPSNLLYQRYRSIALVVYTAVLCAGIIDWSYGGIGRKALIGGPENLRFLFFVMATLTLIGLELGSVGQASFAKGSKVELLPFIARLSLFVGACAITDLNYSQILFLPVLLYSYLAVNKRLSFFIAFLGVAILFGLSMTRVDFMRPPPPPPSLSPNRLPPNRPPAGGSIGGGLLDRSMGSLITLLFTLLLARALSQATQAQQKLSGLLASLEASHVQLKQYSHQVAELAAAEERNRLARDIHDSLGHHLAAINIQLEKANAYKQRDPNRAYEAINHAQRTVQNALKEVRESVSSLRQKGEAFSFTDSLAELITRMNHSELCITLEQTGDSSRYSRLKLITLYRVVQEGLTNVHKHACASQVTIAINFGLHEAQLVLTDNGIGFDVTNWKAKAQKQTTQGLTGLQERVSLVGGTLSIKSSAKESVLKGTTLIISIPKTVSLESAKNNTKDSTNSVTLT